MNNTIIRICLILFLFCIDPLLSEEPKKTDPFKEDYTKYIPDFIANRDKRKKLDPEKMKLSGESSFIR